MAKSLPLYSEKPQKVITQFDLMLFDYLSLNTGVSIKIYSHRVHEDSPYRDRAPSRKLENSYVSYALLILSNIFLLFCLNVIATFKPWRLECQGFDPEGLNFFSLIFQISQKISKYLDILNSTVTKENDVNANIN